MDDTVLAFEIGVAALDGNIHIGTLVPATYHIIAKYKRELLSFATIILQHDKRTAIGRIGLTNNFFIRKRKTFPAMRTYQKKRFPGTATPLIESHISVATGTKDSFHIVQTFLQR